MRRNVPLHPTRESGKNTMGLVGWFFVCFFFEPVCKTLEKILSKYVQLDQACFVVKREFIRKYSGNNKHH